MTRRLHVGLTVVPSRADFYAFLRKWAQEHADTDTFVPLRLTEGQLATVHRVEYSWRWFLRLIYYWRIAPDFERALLSLVREAESKYDEIILYTPDDGYWAELLAVLRSRISSKIRLFNLQHGMAKMQRVSGASVALRRLANSITVKLFGYPVLGLGYGAGPLDGYIVITESERDYIRRNFGTRAYVMPEFIMTPLFEQVAAAPHRGKTSGEDPVRVLWALSPLFARQLNIGGKADKRFEDFFNDVADVVRAISQQCRAKICLRFHPAQDKNECERLFYEAGLEQYATLDGNYAVTDSLIACDFVISYASTVMLEGAVIGRVPVNFFPRENPPHPLFFPNEALYFTRSVSGQPIIEAGRGSLSALFNWSTAAEYAKPAVRPDYHRNLPWLNETAA